MAPEDLGRDRLDFRVMRVGVPKETWPGETRVSLIPSAVAALIKSGLEVIVEERAGTAAGFPDAAYRDQGASIGGHADVFSTADILLQVRSVPPEAPLLRKAQIVIGFADPLGSPADVRNASASPSRGSGATGSCACRTTSVRRSPARSTSSSSSW